jgi:hypothetical protein
MTNKDINPYRETIEVLIGKSRETAYRKDIENSIGISTNRAL